VLSRNEKTKGKSGLVVTGSERLNVENTRAEALKVFGEEKKARKNTKAQPSEENQRERFVSDQ